MLKRICILLMVFLAWTSLSHAQWIQTNGPYGGSVISLAVSGTNLFAGTARGVFLSTNDLKNRMRGYSHESA